VRALCEVYAGDRPDGTGANTRRGPAGAPRGTLSDEAAAPAAALPVHRHLPPAGGDIETDDLNAPVIAGYLETAMVRRLRWTPKTG
jgi:hypothetical protein